MQRKHIKFEINSQQIGIFRLHLRLYVSLRNAKVNILAYGKECMSIHLFNIRALLLTILCPLASFLSLSFSVYFSHFALFVFDFRFALFQSSINSLSTAYRQDDLARIRFVHAKCKHKLFVNV